MKPIYRRIIPSFVCAVLFTAAAVWPARADYTSTVQSHSPLAYWHFSEAGPSPAPFKLANSGSLGSAGDAYAIPSMISGVAGKVNNAVLFSNPGNVVGHCGSRVDVTYNAGLCTPAFSIEFWAKPNSLGADSTGFCPISNFNPNNYGGGRVGWLFYVNSNGRWNFRLGLTSGYAANLLATSGNAVAGQWQHIVATYDGTTVYLYANGAQIGSVASSAAGTGWVPNTGCFLRFGGTPLNGDMTFTATPDGGVNTYYAPLNEAINTAGNRGWDGPLDEVAIYTNALSSSTVSAHYAAASNPATYGATILADHPAGYWNFDEPAFTAPARSALPVAANSGTLLSDADGTNEWGAVAAQPGPGYPGFPAADKAVGFNGVCGSFSVKDAAGLHFTGNLTLAAWVKPAAEDGIREIISHGLDATGAETFLRTTRGDTYGTGNYYEFGASDGLLGAVGYYDSVTYSIPPGDIGNWVFLAGVYDGTGWNLYRNGQLVASAADANGPVDVANSWTIGSRALPSDEDGFRFAGSVAEPAIFHSALSAPDILALYNAAQVPPVITRAPKNPGLVFKNSTVSFDVWAEGSPTLTYMWTSNGVPTGVTATNYTISNIQNGTYTIGVTVTNSYGTATPSVTFTVVSAPPSITTQIGSEWRFVGAPFNFTVGAGGTTPLTYYWYFGTSLAQSGASPTYSGIASLANSGNYTVIVSNETGLFATSGPVVLNSIAVPTGYPTAVNNSAPIAYWRLGESSGTTAHDVIGGKDGTYHSAALGVPGYSVIDPDTAASFGGLNSYAGNISGTAINFTGHTNFTLEAWVNAPAGQNDEATIIAKGIGANGTTRTEQFSLDVAGGAYRFFTTWGNTLYEADAASGPNGSWQHVVGVYDGQNVLGGGSNLYIYVNGVLEGQGKIRSTGLLNNTVSPVSIGSKRTGNDPNYDGTFEGTVDEVAIYNRPLSAATIQAHYAAAYGASLAPFIAVQPSPTTNYASLSVTLTVVAAGTQPLSYQWKRNNVDLTSDTATTSTLVISPLTSDDAGTYKVGITNPVSGIVSISVPLVVLSAPSSPPAIPGLVVHLPFDGNLTDTTGRGNNGTGLHSTTNILVANSGTTNTVAPVYPGFFEYVSVSPGGLGVGQALHYSTDAINTGGTTSIGINDYYVTLGVRPDLQFGSNVNFSVAYWIRLPRGFQGGDLPFFTDAAGSMGNNGFVFAPAYAYGTADSNPTTDPSGWAGCWGFTVYGGGNGIRIYGSNLGAHPGTINDGNWHHLVHVFDREAGKDVTYLDGAVAISLKNAGTTLNDAGDIDTGLPATIGQDPTGLYGEAGSADIDDLGVWRKALTPLEAGSIYIAAISNQLSFAYVDITKLTVQKLPSSQVKLTWAFGTLQAAGNVQGTYTNVPGAVSPYTSSTTNAARTFYRVAY